MGDLYFSPEDFDSVITLEDLTNTINAYLSLDNAVISVLMPE